MVVSVSESLFEGRRVGARRAAISGDVAPSDQASVAGKTEKVLHPAGDLELLLMSFAVVMKILPQIPSFDDRFDLSSLLCFRAVVSRDFDFFIDNPKARSASVAMAMSERYNVLFRSVKVTTRDRTIDLVWPWSTRDDDCAVGREQRRI